MIKLVIAAIVIVLFMLGWFYFEIDSTNKSIEICLTNGFEGLVENSTGKYCGISSFTNGTIKTRFVKISDLTDG